MANEKESKGQLTFDNKSLALLEDSLISSEGWQVQVSMDDGALLGSTRGQIKTFRIESEGSEITGSVTEVTPFNNKACVTIQRANMEIPLNALVPIP